jgi:hypothetical protein
VVTLRASGSRDFRAVALIVSVAAVDLAAVIASVAAVDLGAVALAALAEAVVADFAAVADSGVDAEN